MIILQILKIVISLCCRSVETVLESVTESKVGDYNMFAMTLKWILLIVCVVTYLYKHREKTQQDAEAVRERTRSIMDRLEGLERSTATILTRLEQLQAFNTNTHQQVHNEGNVEELMEIRKEQEIQPRRRKT
ncbi:hypothetical protein Pmani_000188 [Petrolisthes manimaculis]|uniref:Uncharacterized protein n=1 Tax=Petrolisthes manimaculis TaxID=1843537 RepID=A0AAE1QMI9_9EUCA|nr:hypothetical protein Pmani_000188 [Petrolisthes manimaculis]